MKPDFPRINKAIEFTLEYHTKGRVIEYMQAYTRMAKGVSSGSYIVDNWENLLYNLHSQMEKEILQAVYTTNQNTQVIMFEELREWIEIDWRLKEKPNTNFIWGIIYEHNEKVNSELEEKLEFEVEKFQSTEEYKNLRHNEEYEKTVLITPVWVFNKNNPIPYTEKRINRKYYCNELSTDFLDYYQFGKYHELVSRIVGNFRKIVQKHLSLFDAGKYVSLQQISVQKEQLKLNPPDKKLIESAIQTNRKVEFDLSVPQVACLFLVLRELNVINEPVNIDLARFIRANFSTKGAIDISERTMAAQLGLVDTAAIDYWLNQVNKIRVILANMKHPK